MNEKISVLMSVYNEDNDWLVSSVESILNQSYSNLELIIVIDNPNNKNAIDLLNYYAEIDKRIIISLNSSNIGLVASLNRALSISSGKYIARMDADDISHKDRFIKQVEFIQANKLDLIGSNVNLFDNENPLIKYKTDKLLSHHYIKKIMKAGTIGIVHPTFFGKAEVFKTLNGYVNSPHTEDKEFLIRAIIFGYKLGNISEALLDCRYSSESVTKNNAIYVNKMGCYLTFCYREYLRTGKYIFSNQYFESLNVSEKEISDFKDKQILLSNVRHYLGRKMYLLASYSIFKSFFSSKTTLTNIVINFKMKVYRFLESRCVFL